MYTNLIVVYVYMVLVVPSAKAACSDFQTCETCAVESYWWVSCRWCPLSRACHAYGSLYNPCFRSQYITRATKCYDQTPGVYEPDSAYISTLLSAAAYTDEPKQCLDTINPTNDFEIIEVIGKRCEKLSLVPYEECFAYTAVSQASKTIALAFRGTLSTDQLVDQILSILTLPKASFESGGRVQSYFKNAYDALFPCAKQSIEDLVEMYPDYQLVITGHSLGGAIASLAAVSLADSNLVPRDNLSLFTFGMPRLGDKNYAVTQDKLVKNSWRVVHYRDIVAQLPPCDLVLGCTLSGSTAFHHGIEVFYPEEDMAVDSSFNQCLVNEDTVSSCSNGISKCGVSDLDDCILNHQQYFGISINGACVPGTRSGRSVNDPEFRTKYWDMLNEDACTRMDANTLEIKK